MRKYRWSRVYESAEEELEELLAAKNIQAERWVAEDGEDFALHVHELDKTLWCAEGILHITAGDKHFSLQPGDTLDIPAKTPHSGQAGFGGCVCYESPARDLNPATKQD